jgi:hypothetical protein
VPGTVPVAYEGGGGGGVTVRVTFADLDVLNPVLVGTYVAPTE